MSELRETTQIDENAENAADATVDGRPLSAAASLGDDALDAIAQRVLWLSTAMIDAANRGRPNTSGVKVGGHQASSASMVGIMTSLWFAELTSADRVSVKPHAAPVLHAINYLLGDLDESYLTRLREKGGLQSYPSRTKDPDTVDFSTGSVGIGATAPIWAAMSHRYLRDQFPQTPRSGRFISLLGDAELDEGAVWEAVTDPGVRQLGELLWIVDLNRQSLDRIIPDVQVARLQGMFAAADWQVLTCKWGRRIGRSSPGRAALSYERGSTTCPTRSTSACCAAAPRTYGTGCSARPPRPVWRRSSRAWTTSSSPLSCAISAVTTSGCCSTPTPRSTPRARR